MKLLDSTFLVDYWAGEEAVKEYLERHEEAETFVSSVINLKEIAVGRAIQGKLDRNEIRTTFGWVEFLPFEPGHAFHVAEIEANLYLEPGANRDRINSLAGDVLIAAVAKANGATVVTRNVDDFEVFEDVAVEASDTTSASGHRCRSKIALTAASQPAFMVDLLGVALGVFLTLIAVGVHFTRGATWQAPEDISQEVLEHRAATVPETDFPEPSIRAIGGGGGAAAAVAGGAEGELEEGGAEAEEEAGPASIPDDEAETFEIDFVKEGETISVRENETILEAGEDEGWDLPYACREGQCLSCSAHIPDGESEEFVEHWHNQMLGEEELGEGYTLTCVAYPTADFSIETRESP